MINFLKENKRKIMRLILLLFILCLGCAACGKVNDWLELEDDNFFEQSVEDAIESNFRLPSGSIDLTP